MIEEGNYKVVRIVDDNQVRLVHESGQMIEFEVENSRSQAFERGQLITIRKFEL